MLAISSYKQMTCIDTCFFLGMLVCLTYDNVKQPDKLGGGVIQWNKWSNSDLNYSSALC